MNKAMLAVALMMASAVAVRDELKTSGYVPQWTPVAKPPRSPSVDQAKSDAARAKRERKAAKRREVALRAWTREPRNG